MRRIPSWIATMVALALATSPVAGATYVSIPSVSRAATATAPAPEERRVDLSATHLPRFAYPLYLRRPLQQQRFRSYDDARAADSMVYATPVRSSQACYRDAADWWLDHDAAARTRAVADAETLIDNGKWIGRKLVWRYPKANRAFGASAGWTSGMGQGLALACIGGAYAITGERHFRDAAAAAFEGLVAPLEQGGTATRFATGSWYEEVAGDAEPAHILNGMIYALGGIWTLNQADPRPEYRSAFARGVRAVRASIDEFLLSNASLYDLR
ncbi:MAG: D-glucuronyl C5-epimerase family protein, partial [Actinobacteria bacterium]|nr:D-glucuronyl C5-epimerase family protein [Actinomycetota bacterium]